MGRVWAEALALCATLDTEAARIHAQGGVKQRTGLVVFESMLTQM